jgi:hypothetical protein
MKKLLKNTFKAVLIAIVILISMYLFLLQLYFILALFGIFDLAP